MSASEAPPATLPVIAEGITHDLKEPKQWAAWRWEKRGGKWTKPPLNPTTGGYARNNDPDTWGSFEAVLWRMRKDHLPGVGFMFHPEDGLAGVDLDGCLEPETGRVATWALEIVGELGSYVEASHTGTGLKIFDRGKLPPGRRRKGSIEMYDRGRFFTITGHRLADVPATINQRQEDLAQLHRRVFGPEKVLRVAKPGANVCTGMYLTDLILVDRFMHAAYGEKFGLM